MTTLRKFETTIWVTMGSGLTMANIPDRLDWAAVYALATFLMVLAK